MEKRTEFLIVRVTVKQKHGFLRRAENKGLSASQLLRILALNEEN